MADGQKLLCMHRESVGEKEARDGCCSALGRGASLEMMMNCEAVGEAIGRDIFSVKEGSWTCRRAWHGGEAMSRREMEATVWRRVFSVKGLVMVIERQKSGAEAGHSVKRNRMQVTPCK